MIVCWGNLFRSKAMWGMASALLAQAISVLLNLDPQQAQEVLGAAKSTVDVAGEVVTLGGLLFGLYGRLVAKRPILEAKPKEANAK